MFKKIIILLFSLLFISCGMKNIEPVDYSRMSEKTSAWDRSTRRASETKRGVVELATDAETVTGTSDAVVCTPGNITAKMAAPGAIGGTTPAAGAFTTLTATTTNLNAVYNHLTEIDSTDGDDAYTMQTTDIGGTITNQGDDDGLAITLLEASTWYTSNSKISCLTVMDVEGQTININPADGTDQIIWDGCAAGDSLDSSGTKGDLIKICVVGANEIAVFGAVGPWSDAN